MKQILVTLALGLAALSFSSADLLARGPRAGGPGGHVGAFGHHGMNNLGFGQHRPLAGLHRRDPDARRQHSRDHDRDDRRPRHPHHPHPHHPGHHHPVHVLPTIPSMPYLTGSPYQPYSPYRMVTPYPVAMVSYPSAPATDGPTSATQPSYPATSANSDTTEPASESEAQNNSVQYLRQLRVVNNSGEKVTVYVQYCTLDNKDKESWLPADPRKTLDAAAFTLEPGQAKLLKHDNEVISANRVRIWAASATGSWKEFRDRDLWLVPEKDEKGEHYYTAEQIQTSTVTIRPMKG